MSNPVFDRIDKESTRGYTGFGAPQQTYGAPQGYGAPQQPYGYGGPQAYQSQFPNAASASQMNDLYGMPAAGPAQMGRVTYDDVLVKSGLLFGIMLVVAAITWFAGAAVAPGLAGLGMMAGVVLTLVLGLVIAFKKMISPALIVAYAVFEGLLVGGISYTFSRQYDGIVTTAIVATLSVFAAMFLGWKSGVVRVNDKFRRMFGMAMLGYLIFALVNLGFALFGANQGWGIFGATSGMGFIVSIFAVGLASFSLAMDFDSISRAVEAGMPEKYSWLLAHGLLVTVVWLYLEILRLLARFQQR